MIRKLAPILGITFIDIIGFSMMIPMLPYFITHFGASPIVVGVLLSIFSLCQLVAGPVWGHLSDRFGRKIILIISQVGATIGWAMLAFAPTIGWVFVARIIEGVSGGNIGITQAYVADLVEPKERSKAFGYIGATFGAGMVFGPVGGGLLYAKFGFETPFLVAAALQFLTLGLTIFLLPESRSKQEEQNSLGLSEILSTFARPKLARILLQKAALSLGLYGWFAVFALFLQRQFHFGLTETDIYFSVFALSNVFVNAVLIGRLSRVLGDRMMSNLGLASLVVAFTLVPLSHNYVLLVLVMGTFSLGMGLASTGITALISAAAGDEEQGAVLGTSSSLDAMAGVVSPPISTSMLGRFGSGFAAVESLLFATIALALGFYATLRPQTDIVEEAASS
ncbi:MAG: MFS transporter [Vulcanimicrobiaceae bacterium]